MKKSFLKFLSILSKTINWGNMTDFFMDTFTSDVVAVITVRSSSPAQPGWLSAKLAWDQLAVAAASAGNHKKPEMVSLGLRVWVFSH